MAKSKCKCKKAAECEECPEWIFTFADLVMLMMGFFVILWVLKPPAGKDGEPPRALDVDTTAKIRDAFGYMPDPNSNDPVDQHLLKLKGFYTKKPHADTDGGKTTQEKEGTRGSEPDVTAIRPSNHVSTGAKVLFARGEAALSGESTRALDDLAKTIKGYTNIFVVKGHASADDFVDAPAGGTDPAKMALSIARAQAAADYLVSKGVARETLRVQGCGAYEPVMLRAYTPADQALNRRVEVESTGTLVKETQGTPQSALPSLPVIPEGEGHSPPAAGAAAHPAPPQKPAPH